MSRTQDDIAKALDTSVATVSRLRAGKRAPSWKTMIAAREYLDWSIADQAERRAADTWSIEFESRLRALDAVMDGLS